MPCSYLILCHPLLLLSPIPPSIRVFSSQSTLCMRWPKYWSFSFSIIPSKEIPGLISFRMDWRSEEHTSELHHLLWYSYPRYDISILYIKMINFILYSQMYLNFWYFLFVAKDLSFYCSLKHCLKYFQLYSSAGNKFC